MASENGIVAKLVSLRQAFLASVEEARSQFVGRIKEARENYLSQVVDVTLGDPRLSDVERALSSWNEQPPVIQPPPVTGTNTPAATAGMVQIGQSGVPEKFPMKRHRTAFPAVYGTCPSCNSPIWEPQAKFCSQCAFPLEDL